MDASVPVDSTVFMQKHTLRKYLVDNGLTKKVKPDSQEYTVKHGKVFVEAIAAGIGPFEFRRKVERKKQFDVATHDPDALFSIIANQQLDQAVREANDAAREQTTKRLDGRSVAAVGTKPQGNGAREHDSCEITKFAGVKEDRNRLYN